MKTNVHRQQGSTLLESLLAILIFSMGILSVVALLGASVKSSANAKYRNDASLLANEIIGQMWSGERTNASLIENYSTDLDDEPPAYAAWRARVQGVLPGVADANLPTISIDANNIVTVTVFWQAPGEVVHNLVTVARIRG